MTLPPLSRASLPRRYGLGNKDGDDAGAPRRMALPARESGNRSANPTAPSGIKFRESGRGRAA